MRRILTFIILLIIAVPVTGQDLEVKGKVLDENGEAMPGVGIIVKSKPGKGAVSDINGAYSITVDGRDTLEFSFLGYMTAEEPVRNRARIDVALEPQSTMLDQTVVIGYGTSKKMDLTGAVAVVEMDDIKDTPVTSVAESLQGRIAGVDIVSGTGEAGEGTSIQIRGARSIAAGNEPLIVVDGVVDAVSDLNAINPSDIVSISVLKDVSSTAIYGSRGANGVIIVTTDQKPKGNSSYAVTLRSSTGFSNIAGTLDLMDAEEYATWQNMIRIQRGTAVRTEPQSSGSSWAYYNPSLLGKGTDWVKALSQTGVYNNQYAAVWSGNDNYHIWGAFGYTYYRGVVIGSSYHRYTGRANVDTKIGRRITVGARFSLTYYDVERTSAQISGTNTNAAIYLSPLLDTESTWNQYGYEDSQGQVFNNPYISARNIQNDVDKWEMNISPWIKIDFGRGFTLNSTLSFSRDNHLTNYYSPSYLPVAAFLFQGSIVLPCLVLWGLPQQCQ